MEIHALAGLPTAVVNTARHAAWGARCQTLPCIPIGASVETTKHDEVRTGICGSPGSAWVEIKALVVILGAPHKSTPDPDRRGETLFSLLLDFSSVLFRGWTC